MQIAHTLLRALPAVALLPLLAACDNTAASSRETERPVQVERALRAFQPPLRLVLGGFLAFVIRNGRVAPRPQRFVARLVGCRLGEV